MPPRKEGLGYGGEVDVANHYNNFKDRHRTLTSGSDILNLKNLNNWVKSVLIGKHIKSNGAVLDLACGKGGDMLKFQAGKCTLYVGIDIAIASVRDALTRYNGYDGRPGMKFAATLMVGDLCKDSLDAALPAGQYFDLVSCQFALHYSFVSEERARAFLRNVSARLRPGGVFVGTTTDANVLVRRLREAPALEFGNVHYNVRFGAAHAAKKFPADAPFGISYRFSLTESVEDCEEYLVHFPTLRRLAEEHGLELVSVQNFTDLFAAEWRSNKPLLDKMRVLPPNGFFPDAQWEVAHLYCGFAFRKRDDGAPPPPPLPSGLGHRRLTLDDIVILQDVAAGAGGGRKRPRPDEETRQPVKYEAAGGDSLFD